MTQITSKIAIQTYTSDASYGISIKCIRICNIILYYVSGVNTLAPGQSTTITIDSACAPSTNVFGNIYQCNGHNSDGINYFTVYISAFSTTATITQRATELGGNRYFWGSLVSYIK
jgi:hypothetical protein